MNYQENNCDLSIELKSSKQLSHFSTSNTTGDRILIEGTLGKLRHAVFVEQEIIEVEGESGVLRLNITQDSITVKQEKGK